MKKNKCDSPYRMNLKYWQAVDLFGQDAVDAVLCDPEFRRKNSELIHVFTTLQSAGMGQCVLPGYVVWKIAGRPECLYDFYASSSGGHLFPSMRGERPTRPSVTPNVQKIDRQDALCTFGSWCLYMAFHRGMGYKGENPPSDQEG